MAKDDGHGKHTFNQWWGKICSTMASNRQCIPNTLELKRICILVNRKEIRTSDSEFLDERSSSLNDPQNMF